MSDQMVRYWLSEAKQYRHAAARALRSGFPCQEALGAFELADACAARADEAATCSTGVQTIPGIYRNPHQDAIDHEGMKLDSLRRAFVRACVRERPQGITRPRVGPRRRFDLLEVDGPGRRR